MTILPRLILAVPLLFLLRCALDAPVAEDYYAGTDKIAGGYAPTPPNATFAVATRKLDFTAATDPETGAEVARYFIYAYAGVPTTYYSGRNLVKEIKPPDRSYVLPAQLPGTYTLIVTGFDGYRESAVTDANKITFTLP